MFCCTFFNIPSSLAMILMGKRELVALLSLSSWCLVIVVWLFLAVPWVSLQFVIVVFPDHTHLLFLWIICVIYVLRLSCFRVYSLLLCGHLLGKGWPFGQGGQSHELPDGVSRPRFHGLYEPLIGHHR